MKYGIFYIHGDISSFDGRPGWYWEEWTDGLLVERGWHNGTCPPGRDATWQQTELCSVITDKVTCLYE